MDFGAIGITCGSVGEAQAFVEAGFQDVLIANVLGSSTKWSVVADLQAEARVIGCIDDPAHIQLATAAARQGGVEIPLYVELDVGLRRTGVADLEGLYQLAEAITDTEELRLAGLMGYEGHCLSAWPFETKRELCEEALGRLILARDGLRMRGIEVETVSCGGTGDFEIAGGVDGVNEIQAGGGCLMDVLYDEVFHVAGLGFAAAVETRVVSRPYSDTVIIDAGLKAVATHGDVKPRVVPLSDLEVARLSAEHGTIHVANSVNTVSVGDRLSLIPGRIDSTVFLYDHMYALENDRVVDTLELVRSQV